VQLHFDLIENWNKIRCNNLQVMDFKPERSSIFAGVDLKGVTLDVIVGVEFHWNLLRLL
jgi:hypothetical protein